MKYLLNGEETDRLLFKQIDMADFDSWLPFHEDPITSQYWVAEKEEPLVACIKWYEYQFYRYGNDKGGMNALIEKSSGQLIGHSGLLVQSIDGVEELEIAYSLLPAYWNRGYATEAAMKCRDFAFVHGFSDTLISIISRTNIPSEKVALKNGMYLDKTTFYNGNAVNIFRTRKKDL